MTWEKVRRSAAWTLRSCQVAGEIQSLNGAALAGGATAAMTCRENKETAKHCRSAGHSGGTCGTSAQMSRMVATVSGNRRARRLHQRAKGCVDDSGRMWPEQASLSGSSATEAGSVQ